VPACEWSSQTALLPQWIAYSSACVATCTIWIQTGLSFMTVLLEQTPVVDTLLFNNHSTLVLLPGSCQYRSASEAMAPVHQHTPPFARSSPVFGCSSALADACCMRSSLSHAAWPFYRANWFLLSCVSSPNCVVFQFFQRHRAQQGCVPCKNFR
jgi:hypothetical protein